MATVTIVSPALDERSWACQADAGARRVTRAEPVATWVRTPFVTLKV
jgi:hypothetical protein